MKEMKSVVKWTKTNKSTEMRKNGRSEGNEL